MHANVCALDSAAASDYARSGCSTAASGTKHFQHGASEGQHDRRQGHNAQESLEDRH